MEIQQPLWEPITSAVPRDTAGVFQSLTKQGPEQNPSNLEDVSAVNRRLGEQTSRGSLQPELFCDSIRGEGGVISSSTLH